ncbi:hypothetical protein MKEN_00233600 [Mycena kentingensis (nom. inval.)]|nr:hypothetical protein MKEN_00233600 [Mycena kentingensis (nom. inval.)]
MDIFARNGSLIHVFENVLQLPVPSHKRALAKTHRQVLNTNQAYIAPDSFNASFTVPQAPPSFDSQLLYFGHGMQAVDPETGSPFGFGMHRVALQWQYGGSFAQGGSFWTICTQLAFFDSTRRACRSDSSRSSATATAAPSCTRATASQLDVFDAGPGDDLVFFFYNARWLGRPDAAWRARGVCYTNMLSARLKLEEEGAGAAGDYPEFEDVQIGTSTAGGVRTTSGVQWDIQKDGIEDARIAIVFPETL